MLPTGKPHGQDARPHGHDVHGHDAHAHHRDVSGGWLRPAVFGSMDGLVTNVSLIAGVSGGHGSAHAVVLAGLAGLSAGAFSMAAGEFVSVSSQNELIGAEVRKERYELEHHPEAERRELAAVFRKRGVDADLAYEVATQLSRHPDEALGVHVREELGLDYQELAREAATALDEQFARRGGEGRFSSLAGTFAAAARLEADFWQMGLEAQS